MASWTRSRFGLSSLVATILALGMTLAACTGPGASPQPGQPNETASNKTLLIGATAPPATMDPTANAGAAIPQALLYNVYETLVKVDNQGVLKPLLAESWDVASDRLTYTFKLDPATHFASGKKVTADAVVASIERFRASPVASHKTQMSIVESAEAVNDTTVRVKLTRPSNLWLYDMSSTVGMVIDPEGFDNLDRKSAGSGPLELDSWRAQEHTTLKRNPNYWGTPVRYDTVAFKYFADPNAMNAAMQAGQLDIISNLQAPDSLPLFSDTSRFTVIEGTTTGEVVLGLNNASKKLSDIKVRQAISMAIDKQKLVETVWGGKGTVIGSMSVPTDPWFEDLTGIAPYDPEKAKKLLAEAGATNLNLKFRPALLPYATKSARFVASELNAVGIKTTIEELQFPEPWLSRVYKDADYDMTIVAHVEPFDITNFANPKYYWRYDNPEFVKLITQADEAAPDDFVPGMKKATRFLAEDAAAVWLFVLPNLVITKSNISGLPENQTTLSFDVTTLVTR